MKESYPLPSSSHLLYLRDKTLLDLPVSASIFFLDEKARITFEN